MLKPASNQGQQAASQESSRFRKLSTTTPIKGSGVRFFEIGRVKTSLLIKQNASQFRKTEHPTPVFRTMICRLPNDVAEIFESC